MKSIIKTIIICFFDVRVVVHAEAFHLGVLKGLFTVYDRKDPIDGRQRTDFSITTMHLLALVHHFLSNSGPMTPLLYTLDLPNLALHESF